MKAQTFNRADKKITKIGKAEKVRNALAKDKLRLARSQKKDKVTTA